MKKQWIAGALVAATGLQASVPAYADRASTGGILGGVAGAVLGNTVGGGRGRTAAIIVGAIAGSLIGSKVGRNMDDADRRAYEDAQNYCFSNRVGSSRNWSGSTYGSSTNAYGTFTTVRQGVHVQTSEICREYSSSITVNGQTERSSGVACSRSDGSYYEVNSSMVRFDGDDSYSSSRVTPGYQNDYSPGQERSRSRTRGRNSGPVYSPGPDQETDPGQYQDDGESDQGDTYDRGTGYNQGPGTVQIRRVTSMTGGAWYRITFDRPVSLSSIRVQVQGSSLQIYDTAVVTQEGSRLPVPEMSNTGIRTSNMPISGFINRPERVMAIDIRAQSYAGQSGMLIYLNSNEGMPRIKTQVF